MLNINFRFSFSYFSSKNSSIFNDFQDETINVTFHVLVSKHFHFDPNKQKVQLRSERLFGHTSKGAELSVEK